jgi:hypothetical protein
LHVLLHAALLRWCLSGLSEPSNFALSSNTHAQLLSSVGFVYLSPIFSTSKPPSQEFPMESPIQSRKLAFNVDAAAIIIALTFAALIRLNVIHHINW